MGRTADAHDAHRLPQLRARFLRRPRTGTNPDAPEDAGNGGPGAAPEQLRHTSLRWAAWTLAGITLLGSLGVAVWALGAHSPFTGVMGCGTLGIGCTSRVLVPFGPSAPGHGSPGAKGTPPTATRSTPPGASRPNTGFAEVTVGQVFATAPPPGGQKTGGGSASGRTTVPVPINHGEHGRGGKTNPNGAVGGGSTGEKGNGGNSPGSKVTGGKGNGGNGGNGPGAKGTGAHGHGANGRGVGDIGERGRGVNGEGPQGPGSRGRRDHRGGAHGHGPGNGRESPGEGDGHVGRRAAIVAWYERRGAPGKGVPYHPVRRAGDLPPAPGAPTRHGANAANGASPGPPGAAPGHAQGGPVPAYHPSGPVAVGAPPPPRQSPPPHRPPAQRPPRAGPPSQHGSAHGPPPDPGHGHGDHGHD